MKVRIRKSSTKRRRKCGFRARMRTHGGRKVINDRRKHGFKKLTKV